MRLFEFLNQQCIGMCLSEDEYKHTLNYKNERLKMKLISKLINDGKISDEHGIKKVIT